MLKGSSTTHSRDRSRCGSAQMRQGSIAVIALHAEQWNSSSLTSSSALASASTSVRGTFSTWWASRVAVFGPIDGRRASSPTRRARGSGTGC